MGGSAGDTKVRDTADRSRNVVRETQPLPPSNEKPATFTASGEAENRVGNGDAVPSINAVEAKKRNRNRNKKKKKVVASGDQSEQGKLRYLEK